MVRNNFLDIKKVITNLSYYIYIVNIRIGDAGMFTIDFKDLKVIVSLLTIVGLIFSAGMFMQTKFVCVGTVRDATSKCESETDKCEIDLKENQNELKLAEKYITYLEADSNFNKIQTTQNFQTSSNTKLQLQKQLQIYPKTKKKTVIDRFSQLKQMQTEVQSENAIEMRIK